MKSPFDSPFSGFRSPFAYGRRRIPITLIVDENGAAIEADDTPGTYWATFQKDTA